MNGSAREKWVLHVPYDLNHRTQDGAHVSHQHFFKETFPAIVPTLQATESADVFQHLHTHRRRETGTGSKREMETERKRVMEKEVETKEQLLNIFWIINIKVKLSAEHIPSSVSVRI